MNPKVDLTEISTTFPGLPSTNIARSNFLDTIFQFFTSKSIDVVLIEGDSGIGKTTLAAQFAKEFSERTVSLFLNPGNRIATDPTFIKYEIVAQLSALLGKPALSAETEVDQAYITTLFLTVQKHAKGETIFFVVDGLDDIPKENEFYCNQIVELLPIGFKGFQFLISTLNTSAIKLPPKIQAKPFPLSGFVVEQTSSFFSGCDLDDDDIKKIHRNCRGIPSWLSSVRRLINDGIPASEILSNITDRLYTLFDIEWRKVTDLTEDQLIYLSILAHAEFPLTTGEIARIARSKDDIKKICQLSFVQHDQVSNSVTYVTDPFRSYAADKLSNTRQKVQSLIIDDLMVDPLSVRSLSYLPQSLKGAGRGSDLLNYLSPNYFSSALDHCGSIAPYSPTRS